MKIKSSDLRNILALSDLLDVGGGVLLVDRLGGDGAPPPDRLHDVGWQRRLGILLVIRRQERGLGFLRCLLEKDLIRISQNCLRVGWKLS